MWPVTEKFLNSLDETIGVEYEAVYVDNGSPTKSSWFHSLGWYEEHKASKFKSLFEAEDCCLSACWNKAIDHHSSGEYILVANNDIVFHKAGWCEQFEQALNEPDIGFVGLVGMSWRNIPFVQGSLMAFKRETFEKVGRFDERYLFTCEDVDWAKRAQDLGYRFRTFENLRDDGTIEHTEGATRNFYRDMTIEMQRRAHISRIEFCYKWTFPDVSIYD